MPRIPRFSRPTVNLGGLLCVLAFTVVGFVTPSAALAEGVLVLPPVGDGSAEARASAARALVTALESLSYDVTVEPSGDTSAAPEDANDFRALGEIARCDFVLEPRLAFSGAGYELRLRVGYVPRTRLEEALARVHFVREVPRLRELLRVVLRPEGGGAELAAFAGPDALALPLEADAAARAEVEARQRAEQEAEAARLAAEAEAARLAAEADAARQAEADAARTADEAAQRQALEAREAERLDAEADAAWARRERYGDGGRHLALGGIGMMGILNARAPADGGMVAELEGRYGYALPQVRGLELRGGLDIVFGATAGFGLTGGAVYLASPWQQAKVHLGGGLELGYYQALTGNQVAQFLLRAEGLVHWHATDRLFLEGALPVLTVRSANGGVMTMGFAVRAGTRF